MLLREVGYRADPIFVAMTVIRTKDVIIFPFFVELRTFASLMCFVSVDVNDAFSGNPLKNMARPAPLQIMLEM